MAAEKEEARKAWRATKRTEKWKATVEPVGEDKVVVVDGPSKESKSKKRARTAESNAGPNGELEMEAAETACERSVRFS